MSADRDLLFALSAEVRDARARLDGLAARAGDWVANVPAGGQARAMTEVQAFDGLAQRLDVLAAVLHGLARGEAAADLVATVSLSDMAARLAGREPAADAAAGDVALFD